MLMTPNDRRNGMQHLSKTMLGLTLAASMLVGCSGGGREHYSSPMTQGDSQRINLQSVQDAFLQTKAADFNTWMGKFETRVNEIYQGDGVVAIDAGREKNRLQVTGYIEKNSKQGYQADDDKLFAIAQTGDVRNNQMPYQVQGSNGYIYSHGSYGILGNPLVQMFLISQMMRPHYYTPQDRVIVLDRHRNTYRRTPEYQTQRQRNKSFFGMFKRKSDGSLKSERKFSGWGSLFGGSKKRSWGSNGSSGWSGRRSSSWGGSHRSWGGSSGGWGRRRR
jgi:Ni,Fe-hydrogenase I large subunit